MRVLILALLIFAEGHASASKQKACEAQASPKTVSAVNLLRAGYNLQVLSLAQIRSFVEDEIWHNPFSEQMRTVDGYDLHKGFARLTRLTSPEEKLNVQRAARQLVEALQAQEQAVAEAKSQTAEILSLKIGRPLPGNPAGEMTRFEVAGTYQGRPVFSAAYREGDKIVEYLVDPMNLAPDSRMVRLPGGFNTKYMTIDLQVGFISEGAVVSRKGEIFDLAEKRVARSLNLAGIRELNENFVAHVAGKEMLFAVVHNAEAREQYGLVQFDIAERSASPKILLQGDYQYLNRNWVGETPYFSAINLEKQMGFVVNAQTGRVYEVPDVDQKLWPPVSMMYEVAGRPMYALSVFVLTAQDLGPYIRVTDLESGISHRVTFREGLTSHSFIKFNNEPYICYSVAGKIIFKNLATNGLREFITRENEDISTIKSFKWKGMLHFVWLKPGRGLGVLDFQTGSNWSIENSRRNFENIFPFEYQGAAYALATSSTGTPTLVHLSSRNPL